MAAQTPRNKMTVVLVVDMQEGMWRNTPPEPGEEVSELFERISATREERRRMGMEALAADIQPFVDEMRANGARIVWAMMDSDEVMQYGSLYKLNARPDDQFISKNAQSAYVGNVAFFEGLREEAAENDEDLEIKVCGVWALECVINTDVTLHQAGYHSRIVGDLIIDSAKPSQDDDRPNNYEAHALHHAAQATGRDKPAEWKDELLRAQREQATRRFVFEPPEPVEPSF